ncbi:TetR family transcriptional regulator C-terminal domain-containing protein [Eubacteriales bacterium OttesenSCG-928-N14]|nr:TetR family transcriptional regulator C-terminal domain-containing protein [Eubacteriales bacterium OttesenSCG-928-N14]
MSQFRAKKYRKSRKQLANFLAGAYPLVEHLDEENSHLFVRWMLEYIAEHPTLFKNLLLNDINYELMRMLSELNHAGYRGYLEYLQSQGERFDVPIDILTVFISGGYSSLLLWWLDTNMATPIENMENFILSIWQIRG